MSTTRNTDSVANQAPGGGSGEFHARIERDEPMTTKGHQPGRNVGNDAAPTFQAQTLPPGSAPADRTFQPQNEAEVPPNQEAEDTATGAEDTLTGATSGDVNKGLGRPVSGMTSAEKHHDGQHHRKNPGQGLAGVGATTEEFKTVDPRDPHFKNHRALDKDEAEVGRGTTGGPPAEERVPEGAETVAAGK